MATRSVHLCSTAPRSEYWPPPVHCRRRRVSSKQHRTTLDVFRRARVDVAVLEVGLGGRLDATNLVTPGAVAITAIDLDHEQYLGETLEEIAREKAGVIKTSLLLSWPRTASRRAHRLRRLRRGWSPVCSGTMAPRGGGDDRRTSHLRLRTPRHTTNPLILARVDVIRRKRTGGDSSSQELESTGSFSIPVAAVRAAVEDVTWPARLEVRAFRRSRRLDRMAPTIPAGHVHWPLHP